MALCPSDVSGEEVEAELITGVEPRLPEDAEEEDEAEPEEGEDIPPEEEEEDVSRPSIDELTPLVEQGEISFGDEVSGELLADEYHTWIYSGDEVTADLLMSSDDPVDAVLTVYDADGFYVAGIDSGFSGDGELLQSVTLSEGYIVVVNEFGLNDEGGYTLSVIEATEPEVYRPSLDDLSSIEEQGSIAFGDEVTADLATEVFHAWVYDGDEASVDVVVTSDEGLDIVLEIYDADGFGTEYADALLDGAGETLVEVTLADGYTIVINDFGFNDEGAYTLAVVEAGSATVEEAVSEDSDEDEATTDEETGEAEDAAEPTLVETVFVYVDDDGTYLGEDEAAAVDIATLFDDSVEATIWVASESDGSLTLDDIDGHDLLVWYSGEYREEEFDFEGEGGVLFEYLFAGGDFLVIGSASPMVGGTELVEISSVEFLDHPVVTAIGFEAGEFALNGTYQTALLELVEEDLTEGESIFAVRPDGEYADYAVGAAVEDEFTAVKILFFTLPLEAFDAGLHSDMVMGMVHWFGEPISTE